MEKIRLIPYNIGVNIIGLPMYITHYLTIEEIKPFIVVNKTVKSKKTCSGYYRTQKK